MFESLRKPRVNDLWHTNFLAELLKVTKPSVTIEIGIAQGETTRIFSKVSGRVFAIDIDPTAASRVRKLKNVKALIGDSTTLLRELNAQGVKADFIFIDGDHRIDKVMADFESATELLSVNGLIGIHDTYPRDETFVSTENQWCSNSYLAPSHIKEKFPEWRTVTIPVHPGLTIAQRVGIKPFI